MGEILVSRFLASLRCRFNCRLYTAPTSRFRLYKNKDVTNSIENTFSLFSRKKGLRTTKEKNSK